jgi:IS5 family transposase
MAISVAREALPQPYSHPKSPHKYTQAQLAAALVLKTLLRCDYRGIVEQLELMPAVRRILGLKQLFHHTTLYCFQRRLSEDRLQAMLAAVRRRLGDQKVTVAVDSTGLSTTSASAHFVARSGRRRRGYVQMTVTATVGTPMVAAVQARHGPHGDARCLIPALKQTQRNGTRVREVLADRGYDSFRNHDWCRAHGIQAWIPPIVRRPDGTIGGRDRARCQRRPPRYGKRWHVESVISAIKRTTGSTVAARRPGAQRREAILKAVCWTIRR